MSKGGGKGRLPNELVAASVAAVLTVYAAGYWRTRDVARQQETRAQERRVARVPAPAPIAAPAEPALPPPTAAPPVEVEAVAAAPPAPAPTPIAPPAPKEAKVAKKAPDTSPPPPSSATSQPPEIYSVPLDDMSKPAVMPPPGPLPEGFAGWRDGTYTGWGTSNHGDIESKVVIEGGRIVESGIATCATRYPCDVIHTILYQPIQRQSPDVDNVSRATESADAYYYGLVEALEQAKPVAEPATPAP